MTVRPLTLGVSCLTLQCHVKTTRRPRTYTATKGGLMLSRVALGKQQLKCNPLTALPVGDDLVKNLDEMFFYLLAQDGTTSVYWVAMLLGTTN